MSLWNSSLIFIHRFLDTCMIDSWIQVVEIAALSFGVYTILKWLKQDHTKKLLLYVYAYAAIMIAASLLQATILSTALLYALPITALCIITFHQQSLQRQFLRNYKPSIYADNLPTSQWLETVIRSMLKQTHLKKQLFCVIQRSNNLDAIIVHHCIMQLTLNRENIDIIMQSEAINTDAMLIFNAHGILVSVNASFQPNIIEQTDASNDLTSLNNQKKSFLWLTQSSDAIVFTLNPTTLLATLYVQGSAVQNLNLEQLIQTTQTLLGSKHMIQQSQNQGTTYGN